MKEMSEIYDYIRNEHHDTESMANALKLAHSAPDYLDTLMIAKKLFYSVTEKGTIHEQMQFFYLLEKMNIMRHQVQPYKLHLEKLTSTNPRTLKNFEDEATLT